MSSLVIIGIFLGGGALISVLFHNPEWQITQFLFSFRGPFPKQRETFVHFQLRRAGYSASITGVLAIAYLLTAYIDIPNFRAPYYLESGILFVTAIGTIMAAVATMGYAIRAAWHRLFIRTYIFDETSNFFVDAV